MPLSERFGRLSVWNKFFVVSGIVGGVGTIVGLVAFFRPSSGAVVQTMTDSPGGLQVGRDLNIDTDRRLIGAPAETLAKSLSGQPCHIRVGVLGTGGEPDRLAEDLLAAAQHAGCPAEGVFHAVGFQAFDGVQLRHAVEQPPTATVEALATALGAARITFEAGPDPSQPPGALYVYVGYKPSGAAGH